MLRTIHTVTLHVLSVFLFLKGEEDSYLIFNFVLLSCLGCSNVNLGEKVLWCSVSHWKVNSPLQDCIKLTSCLYLMQFLSFIIIYYHLEFSDISVAA